MERETLIILGAGDLGREVMHCVLDNQAHGCGPDVVPVGFLDLRPELIGKEHEGLPVYGIDDIARRPELRRARFICAKGAPAFRKSHLDALLTAVPDARFATVVHRSAVIMPGAVLAAGAYVGCHSTIGIASKLAEHSVVNFNCSVGHDCVVGRNAVVSPGCVLSGGTTVGEHSFLGSAVVTYPKMSIGEWCVVGAQAAVTRPLKDRHKLIPKPREMTLAPESA